MRHAWIRSLVLLVVLSPGAATALVNLRNVGWSVTSNTVIPRDVVAPSDSSTRFMVSFDADVSPDDRGPRGVAFAIVERDGDGPGNRLFEWVLAVPSLPPAGAQVHVGAEFALACDASGRLVPVQAWNWWVSGCTAEGPQLAVGTGTGGGGMPGTSEPEAFELALVDEDGVHGPTPTPEDGLACLPLGGGLTILAALPAPAPRKTLADPPGSIGIYLDPEGVACAGAATPFVALDLFVLVHTSGITDCGFVGAEFRVVGMPPEWGVSVELAPNAFAIGSPLGSGVAMAFTSCHGAGGAFVRLYTLHVFPTTAVADLHLSIEPRLPPTNPTWRWSMVTLCDAPYYTAVRVDGLSAVLNPTVPPACDVAVGTQPVSWSRVKTIYRD